MKRSCKKFLSRALGLSLSSLLFLTGIVGCTPADNHGTDGETTGPSFDETESRADTLPDTMEEVTDGEQTTVETEPETEASSDAPPVEPVEAAWPKKSMTFSGDRVSSVRISAGSSASEQYAARELQAYLEKMSITVEENGEFPMTIQTDASLGDDSYRITTGASIADGMIIAGGNGRGVLYGVYSFLEEKAGVRFYTPVLETCSSGVISLKADMDLSYTPIFELRQHQWGGSTRVSGWETRNTPEWCVKNKVNMNMIYGDFSEELGGSWKYGLWCHTMGQLTGCPMTEQPCLTDLENLERAIAEVLRVLAEDPNVNAVTVGQNDNFNYCRCENCTRIAEEEGSQAGPVLRFVNAVAEAVEAEHPNVIVETFAYQYSRQAPAITRPRSNVRIRLCTIECCFAHALDDPECAENASFFKDLVDWSEICDQLYIWDYTTNFHYYIPTFPNFGVLRRNMRLFADYGVKGVFPQGNDEVSVEFGELRTYLLAKLLEDPYMTEEEYNTHMDQFLQAFYGEGWQYIRMYIDQTSALAAREISVEFRSIYENPFSIISRKSYKAMEPIFDQLWDKAEELAGDRLSYVQRSRLQWRYIKLMLDPNEADAKALIEDVAVTGAYWREHYFTSRPAEGTDLSKSPVRWFK